MSLIGKQFKQITLDPKKCRVQIDEFGTLLKSKASLSEKNDIQPFFKNRPPLSAFIGSYMRDIGPATDYTFEYPFYGDFAADLDLVSWRSVAIVTGRRPRSGESVVLAQRGPWESKSKRGRKANPLRIGPKGPGT